MNIHHKIFSVLMIAVIAANIVTSMAPGFPNIFDGVKVSASSGNINPTNICSSSGYYNYPNLPYPNTSSVDTPTASDYVFNTPINTDLEMTKAMFNLGLSPAQTNWISNACIQSLPTPGYLSYAGPNPIILRYRPETDFVGTVFFDVYLESGSVNRGDTNVFRVTINVGPIPITIRNTATINASTNDPNTANNTATAIDNLCYSANSTVAMTATTALNGASTSIAGLPTIFTSIITNNGPSTITTADVNFKYDSSKLSGLSVTTSSGVLGTGSTAGSGTTTIYNNSLTGLSLASGQSVTVTYTANVSPTYTGTITPLTTFTPTGPTSTAAGCSMIDINPLDNTDQSATTTVTSSADMSITKTSDSSNKVSGVGQIIENTNVVYTITATNNGPSTAGQPVVIIDTYDSTKLQYQSNNVAGSNMTCQSPDTTIPTAATISCTSTTPIENAGIEQITITFKAL